MEGFCATCNTYGYEVFEYLKNLIQKKIKFNRNSVIAELGLFVENGFLKALFDKSPQAMDKAQLLVETFGESANPNNFSIQAQAMNIQPTTLSRKSIGLDPPRGVKLTRSIMHVYA
ncbi:hypothetical protein RhiirA1_401925 [Rhizophagus irregularis]|uniref:Uncharacterized protein n=1 Tax=Rhizophagus irregularis TaxID=588596 RepID=A0A2N0R074_9GLOM|nr:hypothetical protein RhiirA1_401925 [Rhizophagus irregularis]